jgi:hypothetical protein
VRSVPGELGCNKPAVDSVVLPFSIWREAFINDADLETARRAFGALNPQPMRP